MSKTTTNKDKINEILTRGVGEFIDPEGIFRKKLETSPEKIVIKFGVDPTRPDIHLGHAVVFRKLRQLQDIGCKVVFLIGDYTGQIGDPTGKSKVRPELEQTEIENNMKTFTDQVGKILNTKNKNLFSWIRNSDWFTAITDIIAPVGQKLEWVSPSKIKISNINANSSFGKLLIFEKTRMQINEAKKKELLVITLRSFLWSLKHITHSRLIERDMFKNRIKNGEELYLHEMMYPVLQGIDSFAISHIYGSCDIEVGGTDQTFNMLMGRDIMKMNKKEPQAVLAFKLLEGTDGKEKMSKSLDNYIGITDEPIDMYGKIMSIPDSSIGNYFELCTFTTLKEVENIRKGVINGSIHPKEAKMDLAKQVVSIYHGEKEAKQAQDNWEKTFSKKEIPENVLEIKANKEDLLVDVLLKNKIVESKTDFRRLIDNGAITNMETEIKVASHTDRVVSGTYRIGKKRFCKINIK
jgi:tyrosyl-tRNA synthetase